MKERKIPIYAVCGADAADRQAFFREFCRTPAPLWVQCGGAPAAPPAPRAALVPADMPAAAAGEGIAEAVRQTGCDAVWLDWDDALPVERLLALPRAAGLAGLCRLRKIVRCGSGAGDTARLAEAESPVGRQFAQCDLFAVHENDKREIRRIRGHLLPLQPNIEVIPREDRAEIAAVLNGRNVLQGVRFAFILVAVAALLAVLNRLQFSIPDSIAAFLGTYLQALPFLLLGILLSSVIQVFVPADLLQRIFPKNLLGGMLFGVLGGFLLPICDCASIPVFRSLVRKGVPLPAAVTFMIAAPIINPVVMLSTYYAFGANTRIMLTRMAFGVVCSLLIGLCFAWEKKSVLLAGAAAPVCACSCGHSHGEDGANARPGFYSRLQTLLTHFREEFFEVARFLLIGIGVSTVLQLVMGSKLTGMDFSDLALSMLVMMALAFFLSLCSSSDAVVGRNMGTSLPLGAVMSFMVFGPMIDVKNLILMAGSFTKRFMIKLLIATFIVSFATVYAAFSLGLGALIS